MKYTAATLLFLGAIKAESQLQRINTQTGTFVDEDALEDEALVQWTDEFGPGETGIIDALTPPEEACKERLWLDQREIDWQIDMFSRTCERQYYNNAVFIAGEIKGNIPKIHTWELLDKSFAFQRVRRYDFVNDQMNMVEHFQDNLNQNRSNLHNVENFVRVCATVRNNLAEKYHDGEMDYPWSHDPRQEALDKYNAGKK